jgi:mannose-6-phosphate isomerase
MGKNRILKLIPNQVRNEGGREMDRFRGIYPPQDKPYGSEAWVGSVTRAMNATNENPDFGCSKAITSDGKEAYLFQLIDDDPAGMLGEEHLKTYGKETGLLVKLLDAKKQYLLQAHPNRAFAKKMWNSNYSKDESSYVIAVRDDVDEPPYIILGFKEGITKELFMELYQKEDISALEILCHKIPVKSGDSYFVPSGMPHCLGKGCLVCEVQEPCEISVIPMRQEKLIEYRKKIAPMGHFPIENNAMYEKKLFGSFDFTGYPLEEIIAMTKSKQNIIRQEQGGVERLIVGEPHTPYFSYKIISSTDSISIKSMGSFQIGIVLNGNGKISSRGEDISIKQGDELFIPYGVRDAVLHGNASLILCSPGN